MTGVRTLIIDNYDSFTFNLYQLIGQVNGEEPVVIRNDEFTWNQISGFRFDNLVVSPGPGRPENTQDFGVCKEAILRADVPVLGVCLGHQGIAHAYGGTVQRAREAVHGRIAAVHHDGSPLFREIPSPFRAVRYHSLAVAPELPSTLRMTAWTSDGTPMGIVHRHLPRYGVQYHPESVCTEYGDSLLKNFRDLTPRRVQTGYSGCKTTVGLSESGTQQATHRLSSRKIPFECSNAGAIFKRLYAEDPHAFWLDSNDAPEGLSRFSFMGGSGGPLARVFTFEGAHGVSGVFEDLSAELSRLRCSSEDMPFDFQCGFVGFFGYESGASFLFADRLIAFDHSERTAWLVSYGNPDDAAGWFADTERELLSSPKPVLSHSRRSTRLDLHMARGKAAYLNAIASCQKHILNGESYEICLTNQISANAIDDPLALYLRMRSLNPSPYSAYLRCGGLAVLSSSPERFLKIDTGGTVESKPMKGTRPRGRTPEEDVALARELAESEKERSENLMIVDLLRNDLGRVCEQGSVSVPQLMQVETYRTVHQLVSTVRGRLKAGLNAVDCIRAAFPGGSMTGAPKIRTMKLIEQLEACPRGVYSGALGFLSLNGAADLSIVIRTLISTSRATTLGIGGAVVALSDPEAEFEETLVKARASVQALLQYTCGTQADAQVERVLSDLREHGQAYCEAFSA